jgi:hypothetical protein
MNSEGKRGRRDMADEVCTSASLDTFCCQIMLHFDTDISFITFTMMMLCLEAALVS